MVGIKYVQRNGDFQTVFFTDGSQVYGSSEQFEPDGDWRDSTGVENVVQLVAAFDAIRALHHPVAEGLFSGDCDNCVEPWPCATVRVLDGETS